MSVLYKPKFCCHCGEAIDRLEWKLWTSRRFCDVCGSTQKQFDLMPRFVVAAGLLAGLFGISGFMAHTPVENTRPVAVVSAKPSQIVSNRPSLTPKSLPVTGLTNSTAKVAIQSTAQLPPTVEGSKPKTILAEPIYYCGAATKKGTPCSRRVKSPGRCWQHLGQPSIAREASMGRSK